MMPTDTSMYPIRTASYNVQGLNSLIKCCKLFQTYHSQHLDVLFLQETHFPKQYNPSFTHHKYPQFYLSNAQEKTKMCLEYFFPDTHPFPYQKKLETLRVGFFSLQKPLMDPPSPL